MQSTLRSQSSKAVTGDLLKQAVSAFFPVFQFSSMGILSGRNTTLTFPVLLHLRGGWGRHQAKGSGSFFSIAAVFLPMHCKCIEELAILEKHREFQGEANTDTNMHSP